jgi:50S ribosomal protein L16 3-hydroxylase
MHLTNFDIDAFLRDSWQKQPVLIPNPWAEWRNPLSSDELAGLACEDHIEARLITQPKPDKLKAEHGPFPETRFGKLGRAPWTLLVQAVDHHVPEVAALIEPFRFVPNWRIDDVMVSYASDGGGVGAHFDHYDVFLVQGQGQRRWQVGQLCDDTTALLPHDELRLLADFQPRAEWLLGPGDILYVPPRWAHNGVAVGDDCMTYSVGFRAPSRGELISGWCDELVPDLLDEDRYGDPGLTVQANPGEISAEALRKLHAMVTEKLADRPAFARWFGSYSTTRKYPDVDWAPEQPLDMDDLHALLAEGAPLLRNPASRFSFIRSEAGSLVLFVDGAEFACEGETAHFAEALCAADRLELGVVSDATARVLLVLLNNGSVGFEGED